MSIHAHKTGINKTTGQKSDAIYSTSLTGNWIPGTGVNTHFWDNQVGSGKNIRRINTVATGSSPSHWIFSGTNDYFGSAESGYGGDPFGINTGAAFTLAQWFKNDSGVAHVAFSLVYSNSNIVKLIISQSGGTANKAKLTVGSETPVEFDYTFADDTWYYISLVYAGSNVWSFFVNGSFVGSSTISVSGVNPAELQIGRDAGTSTYSGGTIKIGHVHVYSAALKNSQLRQNFLASHVINNTRVYGATYTA
jgi:hypothetical protein